jgi:hypothetical protein
MKLVRFTFVAATIALTAAIVVTVATARSNAHPN